MSSTNPFGSRQKLEDAIELAIEQHTHCHIKRDDCPCMQAFIEQSIRGHLGIAFAAAMDKYKDRQPILDHLETAWNKIRKPLL